MMKYLFVPNLEEIPEWKECYYDYNTLHRMIEFIEECELLYDKIQMRIETTIKPMRKHKHEYIDNSPELDRLRRASVEVREIMENWNDYFCEYSEQEKSIIYTFIQYKSFELHDRFKLYRAIYRVMDDCQADDQREKILTLIENLYIEVFYTQKAISFNIAKITKVEGEYSNYTNKYGEFLGAMEVNTKLLRMRQQINSLSLKIEMKYIIASEQNHKVAEKSLKRLGESNSTVSVENVFNIGLVFGVIILMLAVVMAFKEYEGIQLEKNKVFTQKFPVWRGASYVIFYLWILGLDILFYESSQINYKLIFHFQSHHLPHSKILFLVAATLTLIYFVLFFLFLLELSGRINTGFLHFGEVFWLIILVYLFLPFPILHYRGRIYFFKLMLRILASPFISMNFLIIWMGEQLVSLNQPFSDFFYTVCGVVHNWDYVLCKTQVPNFASAYIIWMFTFRIIQNLKFWRQICIANKKYDFMLPPFLGFIRAFFGLNTAIAALLFRLEIFPRAQTYWLVLVITATLVSWIVDLKGDWGLLGFDHKFLREKLLFPNAKGLYYFFAIFNLVLRTAWALSISPFVVKSTGFLPFIFIMIISYIEILRRGIWNFLRLQFEHIRNCGQYQATIKDKFILDDLVTEVKNKWNKKLQSKKKKKTGRKHEETEIVLMDPKVESQKLIFVNESELSLSEHRKTKQLELFKEKLKKRIRLKEILEKNYIKNLQQIAEISKGVKKMLKNDQRRVYPEF